MLSGKLNEFTNSCGSESSPQVYQNNCKQVQFNKDRNLSVSASYHPTDSETSDDEEYMRKEMACDRKNDIDYMAEVRDLQIDAHIPIEKLLRLYRDLQEHSNIRKEENVNSLLRNSYAQGIRLIVLILILVFRLSFLNMHYGNTRKLGSNGW